MGVQTIMGGGGASQNNTARPQGGGGASGAGGGGGGGGGGATYLPFTMADGYANSLYVNALNASREGGIDPGDISCYPLPDGDKIDACTVDAKSLYQKMKRWDRWVVNYLAIQELLRPLVFEASKSAGATVCDQLTVSARNAKCDKLPLSTLIRPKRALFVKQLPAVLQHAELRDERAAEILAQIDNQAPFWYSIVPTNSRLTPATLALIEAVTQLTVFVEMRFKNDFGSYRPFEFSPQVQPMITTPGHGTYPMGHAAQAFAVARLLDNLLPAAFGSNVQEQLFRLAHRIGENRIVAGVHFPIDLLAGLHLGLAMADYAVGLAVGNVKGGQMPFDPEVAAGESPQALIAKHISEVNAQGQFEISSPILNAILNAAVLEWSSYVPAVVPPSPAQAGNELDNTK